MQDHVRDRRIGFAVGEGQATRFAPAKLDPISGFRSHLRARRLEHAAGMVDCDDPESQACHLHRQDPGSGSDVDDGLVGLDQATDRLGAQHVVVEYLAQGVPLRAHGFEEVSGPRCALFQNLAQGCRVATGGWTVAQRTRDEFPGVAPGPFRWGQETVEDIGAVASVLEQARFSQDGQVARDPRLRHSEHAHQLLNREFFALQERQDTHAGGIREDLEDPLKQIGAAARGAHCLCFIATGGWRRSR